MAAALCLTASCDLHVTRAFFCDDYSDHCEAQMPEAHQYQFQIPADKTRTWRDLSFYMYFHSRQTPGLRVDFSRKLTEAEADRVRRNGSCPWTLVKNGRVVGGHLEGFRLDENGAGMWCFDYLGTMLLEYHKKYGSVGEAPRQDFFPVNLQLEFHSGEPGLSASLAGPVTVRWDVK